MNTSNTPTTLIFGARGQIGGELARLLQADGQAVVRATHGPATEQDQAHIDLGSGAGIDAAFARAHRAFLLCPPGSLAIFPIKSSAAGIPEPDFARLYDPR